MNYHGRLRKTGQAIVEFALIAPLLFALLFVLIELGVVISIYIGLTNSAREAARAGVAYQFQQPANPTGTPSVSTVDGQRMAVMDAAILASLNPLIDVASVAELNAGRYSYQPANPSNNNYRYGDKLIVSLSYTHHYFFNLLGTSVTLTASSEMRLEPGGR